MVNAYNFETNKVGQMVQSSLYKFAVSPILCCQFQAKVCAGSTG